MTNVQAAEILTDLSTALHEGTTLRITAPKATLRALAMAVVALVGEPGATEVVDAELEEET
jgi:hypothetical protein